MKTITKSIYSAFVAVGLAIGALTANGATGDLIAAQSHGDIFQLPINPVFGTPSLVWDNANLLPHAWCGIAFDQAGNVYVSEPGEHAGEGSLYRLSPDRTTLSLFASGLNGAKGLAVDTNGNLYQADIGSGNIYRFTPEGVRTTFASGLSMSSPNTTGGTILFDSQGNLYAPSSQSFPDCPQQPENCLYHAKIYKISPQGLVGTFVDLPSGFAVTGGIGVNSVGNLFVLATYTYGNPRTHRLLKYASGGGEPEVFGGGDLNYGTSISGGELVIDSADNIYIAALPATILKYPPAYHGYPDPADPVSSIYIGVEWWNAYETLGQLVIQPSAYAAQIQPPINADGTSIFNARRGVVSVRFTLTYGGVATCTLPPATIAVTRTAGGVTGQVNESVYTASADTGSNFRVNGCQYMYNLDSRALGVGVYRVDVKIYGGTVGSVAFELR